MEIPIAISNRHIHLSQKDAYALFGNNYTFKELKSLSQPGEFACMETVDIVGQKGKIEQVRVIGPIRENTQVEITVGDSRILGLEPPIKHSGDIEESSGAMIIGPNGSITLEKGIIIAARHIHMNPEDAKQKGLENGQHVSVETQGPRSVIFKNVMIRINERYKLEMHVDIEEGNAAGIQNGDLVHIL